MAMVIDIEECVESKDDILVSVVSAFNGRVGPSLVFISSSSSGRIVTGEDWCRIPKFEENCDRYRINLIAPYHVSAVQRKGVEWTLRR